VGSAEAAGFLAPKEKAGSFTPADVNVRFLGVGGASLGMLFRFKRPAFALPALIGVGVEDSGRGAFLGVKKFPSIWGAMLLRPEEVTGGKREKE